MHPNDTPGCFAHHMGLWAIEPHRLQTALWLIQQGLYPEQVYADSLWKRGTVEPMQQAAVPAHEAFSRAPGQVAIIRLIGPMSKGVSKFAETSTIQIRQAIRQAVADEQIRSLLLAIDSPGGMVAGTAELADEVQRAKRKKPVMAFIEDVGASAAYWVASQADSISANRIAEVGSIGVLAVLTDSSGMAERSGVQVHVISTGPYKGMGVAGSPVLPEHLADIGDRITAVAQHFFQAVQRGRSLNKDQIGAVTDGRVFPAAEALKLGLIDRIQPFEDALAEAAAMPPPQQRASQRLALADARTFWEEQYGSE